MTRYVALLRGINVGGNNIIPMKALAQTFERLKLASVRTYIQSGNVLFETTERDARALEVKIERALKRAHACEAKVVVRGKDEMARVIAGLPRSWKRAVPDKRYNVLFLRHEIDSESILADLAPKPGIEEVSYGPGVLYWSAGPSEAVLASDLSARHRAKPQHHEEALRAPRRTELGLPQVTLREPERMRRGSELGEDLAVLLRLVCESPDLDQDQTEARIERATRAHHTRTSLARRRYEPKATRRTTHDQKRAPNATARSTVLAFQLSTPPRSKSFAGPLASS